MENRMMPVGEVAKLMGVSVRTVQYYEQQGLLPPAVRSEGGRRLYSGEDLVRLHQILSLKALGFSLHEIRERLLKISTVEDLRLALDEQIEAVDEEMQRWQRMRSVLSALRRETSYMDTLDLQRCADIVYNAQIGNNYVWMLRGFDNGLLDVCRSRFNREDAEDFVQRIAAAMDVLRGLMERGADPQSEEAVRAAEQYWGLVLEFTRGDEDLIRQLAEVEASQRGLEEDAGVGQYMEAALGAYFAVRQTGEGGEA